MNNPHERERERERADFEGRFLTVQSELEKYKKFVKGRLDKLVPIFAKASVGDFTKDLEIPALEDEFTEFYVGIQIMLEVIREKIAEYENLNAELENKVSERTVELSDAQKNVAKRVGELERLNKFMVGRELKMIDLKKEIERIKKK